MYLNETIRTKTLIFLYYYVKLYYKHIVNTRLFYKAVKVECKKKSI